MNCCLFAGVIREKITHLTINGHEMVAVNKHDRQTLKPRQMDYNANMGVVNIADMQLSFIESGRKCIEWYKKLFFHILDIMK